MPKSFRKLPSRLLPAPLGVSSTAFFVLALAACSLLQGCFSAAEDSPYTVAAGETIHSLQMEIEPDGTLLLAVRTAMYFSHEDPLYPWDSVPRARNFQTYIYRRSQGAWTATPFKNLQREYNVFPVLLPDLAGRFQALVWDYRTAVRYVFREERWEAGKALGLPRNLRRLNDNTGRNWSRHPHIGLVDDSTAYFINTVQGLKTEVSAYPGGERTFLDTSNFIPMAFHVAPGYLAAAGTQRPFFRQGGGNLDLPFHFVYFSWRAGADSAAKRELTSYAFPMECVFLPYKGSTALFANYSSGIRITRLDSTGLPAEEEFLPYPDSNSIWLGGRSFAMDSTGCMHRLNYFVENSPNPVIAHLDECSGREDTIPVPGPRSSRNTVSRIGALSLRIHPSGEPVVAFLVWEVDGGLGNQEDYHPSTLYLAERKGGIWAVERIAEK